LPRERIDLGEALESHLGQPNKEKQKTYNQKSPGRFVRQNDNPARVGQIMKETRELLVNQSTFITQTDSLSSLENTKQIMKSLNDLLLHDRKLQEVVHKLLEFTPRGRKGTTDSTEGRVRFPIKFIPNPKSKSEWQIRWHAKAAALVKCYGTGFHDESLADISFCTLHAPYLSVVTGWVWH